MVMIPALSTQGDSFRNRYLTVLVLLCCYVYMNTSPLTKFDMSSLSLHNRCFTPPQICPLRMRTSVYGCSADESRQQTNFAVFSGFSWEVDGQREHKPIRNRRHVSPWVNIVLSIPRTLCNVCRLMFRFDARMGLCRRLEENVITTLQAGVFAGLGSLLNL